MTLHFGYGSNLWFEQMNSRCPDNIRKGKGILKNYKWIIAQRQGKTPAANIIVSEEDFVEGYVFELSPNDEKRLDVSEGMANQSIGYEKINLNIEFGLEYKSCMVYIDKNNVEHVRDEAKKRVNEQKWRCSVGCECTYASRINKGVIDAGMSETYVKKYIRKFIDE